MGKRIEMDLEEKEYLIQECLAGRMRMREAARRAGVGHSTMHNWISRYRAEGASALSENGNAQKRTYSEALRQKVVEEYLSGQGSSMAIAEKYKLRSGNLVLDWANIIVPITRACLKNIKTPKQRTFFRRTALKNLEIHKVFLRFLPCPAKNLSLLVILLFIKQALTQAKPANTKKLPCGTDCGPDGRSRYAAREFCQRALGAVSG